MYKNLYVFIICILISLFSYTFIYAAPVSPESAVNPRYSAITGEILYFDYLVEAYKANPAATYVWRSGAMYYHFVTTDGQKETVSFSEAEYEASNYMEYIVGDANFTTGDYYKARVTIPWMDIVNRITNSSLKNKILNEGGQVYCSFDISLVNRRTNTTLYTTPSYKTMGSTQLIFEDLMTRMCDLFQTADASTPATKSVKGTSKLFKVGSICYSDRTLSIMHTYFPNKSIPIIPKAKVRLDNAKAPISVKYDEKFAVTFDAINPHTTPTNTLTGESNDYNGILWIAVRYYENELTQQDDKCINNPPSGDRFDIDPYLLPYKTIHNKRVPTIKTDYLVIPEENNNIKFVKVTAALKNGNKIEKIIKLNDDGRLYIDKAKAPYKVDYGQDFDFKFDVINTWNVPQNKILWTAARYYTADADPEMDHEAKETKRFDELSYSIGAKKVDPITKLIPGTMDLDIVCIRVSAAIQDGEPGKNYVEKIIYLNRSNIPNLKANYYVGDTNVKTDKPMITVGANVTNTTAAVYKDVDFEVKVNDIFVTSFKSNIKGNITTNYTTTIPNPGVGVHKVTVTVNPANSNPVETFHDDNTVTGTLLVYNEPSGINFQMISYEGEKSVPKFAKNINVKVKLDNNSDRVFTGEDFVIEFNGNTYNRAATILPGTNIYSLGSVPSPMVVGSYPMTVTVNKNGNPVETNANDNKITQSIQVTPVDIPPPPDNITFELKLLIDGQTGEYTTKSGYGIPIEVVVEKFTHHISNNPSDAQCISSPGGSSPLASTKIQAVEGLEGVGFNNFNIQPGSTARIIAKGFTFSMTPFGPKVTEMTLSLDNVSGQTALFKGKIYTDPMTEDSITAGNYEFVVDIRCNAQWQERIRWWNPHQSLIYRCPHETHSGHMGSACSESSQHSHCTGARNDCNGHSDYYYCSSQNCTGHSSRYYCGGCRHSHTSACYPLVCYRCTHPYRALECGDGDTCISSNIHISGCCYKWQGGWEYEWIDSDFHSYDFKEMFIHQQLEGTIQIKGSMYDDDQTTIIQ